MKISNHVNYSIFFLFARMLVCTFWLVSDALRSHSAELDLSTSSYVRCTSYSIPVWSVCWQTQ